ncbi:MAG TPA: hydrogenase maturation protease, partial [Bryobacteraceae bacterium]|nr:hydrogenase maturation protease [Bryobacteraceae bacterium]
MKPVLVVGLGNSLMGDDGVGWRVAEWLTSDPRLPPDTEVIFGGTDLLSCAAQMEGRRRVIVLDAVQSSAPPGAVSRVNLAEAEQVQENVHQLSAPQAIQLLKLVLPARFELLGISVSAARLAPELSSELAEMLPAIVDRVLEE